MGILAKLVAKYGDRQLSEPELARVAAEFASTNSRSDLDTVMGTIIQRYPPGGVGDTVPLVLLPLVASCGAKVVAAAPPGRGLAAVISAPDQLRSIPGFRTELPTSEIANQLDTVGCAVFAHPSSLMPVDNAPGRWRALAGKGWLSLVAALVTAEGLRLGAEAIMLDIKVDPAAGLTKDEAFVLAAAAVAIGKRLNLAAAAVISGLEQPLGSAVGRSLEVAEAVETLRGFGPPDLENVCTEMGAHLLCLVGAADNLPSGRKQLRAALHSGRALARLREMVAAQGGDGATITQPIKLPRASLFADVNAPAAGYVQQIDAAGLGQAVKTLGVNQYCTSGGLDPAVGILLRKKIGDAVGADSVLAQVHAPDSECIARAISQIRDAYTIGPEPIKAPPLIYGAVTPSGVWSQLSADI